MGKRRIAGRAQDFRTTGGWQNAGFPTRPEARPEAGAGGGRAPVKMPVLQRRLWNPLAESITIYVGLLYGGKGMSDRTEKTRARKPVNSAGWLPLLIGMLLLVLDFGIWKMLSMQEKELLNDKIMARNAHLAAHIETDLLYRIPALRRMAHYKEIHQGISRSEYIAEAKALLADLPGFCAIEWADRNAVAEWTLSLAGTDPLGGRNLSSDKNILQAMDHARISKETSISGPVELAQGEKGFLVCVPVCPGGNFEGEILAVSRFRDWLDFVFRMGKEVPMRDEFRLAARFDDTPVYTQEGWADAGKNGVELISTITILDHKLHLVIRPTAQYLSRNASVVSVLLAVIDALFSLLVALLVRQYQLRRLEAFQAQDAKEKLEREILEREKAEAELTKTLNRIEWATRSANMGLWMQDLATNKLIWNDLMYKLLDVPRDIAPTCDTWEKRIHPDDLAAIAANINNAIDGTAILDTEYRYILSDGLVRTMRLTGRVERDEQGNAIYIAGLNWDITGPKEAEAALRKSEEQVRLLLNSTGEAIYGIDLQGNCTFANTACARMLGYADPDMLLGQNMHFRIHHSYPDGTPMPVAECKIFRAFREGLSSHEDNEVMWRKNGTSFPAEYWSYPQIVRGEIQGAVVTFMDITERKKAEQTITHLATHDSLTDLPTIRLYKDRLSMAIHSARRQGKESAVMFLDLDSFKAVNDTYGHEAGDEADKV